ncbi:MAG: hypothetical protein JST22_08300 [Bacteroidetes bacterium]|nr:hypothetical protein [Bacteroidota bacterium]
MTRALLIFSSLLFILLALPCAAQYGDGHIRRGIDTLKQGRQQGADTTNASDTLNPDTKFFQEIDSAQADVEPPEPTTFFRKRGGFYGGATIDFTSLNPRDLDPTLDGTPVYLGIQGYVLLNSWLLGGAGTSATLYGISSNYDRFSLSYGGILLGYDTRISRSTFSLQGSLLAGAGGIEMLKKRPDLGGSAGREILERTRSENFFVLRPGISIGYAPTGFLQFSIGTGYLYTVGSDSVVDLRKMVYGLHITLGIVD